MSLYQHFRSKDDLVIEFLKLREQRFTRSWQNEVKNRKISPRARLLVVFDVFDQLFQDGNFSGCSFIKILMEADHNGHIQQATKRHLDDIRLFYQELAEEAKINDAASFAHLWQILTNGAFVAAYQGYPHAARLAKITAEILLKNWQGQSG